MALTIPAEPKEIRPDLPPPGFRVSLVNFNDERKLITPRLQLAHTNGASVESNIEKSKSWAERRYDAKGKATTLPHFQIDLDGDAALLLELNRQGIAAYRANSFSISYETADRGYLTDTYPNGSYFTEPQMQKLANGFAYCSMLFKIPLYYPATWDGAGSASHTEPFGYPYWTTSSGKSCPGLYKKAQVRNIVMPHARKIVAAWTAPPPTAKTYTVVSGDSWWGISRKLQISMTSLLQANTATSATMIHPGDVLKVPAEAVIPGTVTDWAREGASMSTPPEIPTLRRGVVHANVPWLQAVLCAMKTLPADGAVPIFNPAWVGVDRLGTGPETKQLFGDATHNSLAYWQSKNGLSADGVYGPQTAARLHEVRQI